MYKTPKNGTVIYMIGKRVEEKGYVTVDELYEILGGRKKGSKPLTYEQQAALEYAEKFKSSKDYKTQKKALEEMGISSMAVIKLLEIRPKSPMLARQILAHEKTAFNDNQITQILAIISEKEKG